MVEACVFPLQIVLVVTDLTTITIPSNLLQFRLFLRIDQRPHPRIIQTVRLHHIYDRESILHVLPGVTHREVEPLGVTECVPVGFQYQLVFELEQLNGTAEIARFEAGLEDEGGVVGAAGQVVG